uniref:Deoxyuridine 5'-triphosphate nucleotidohydrolase n=1 Tax=Aegilops tauschii TaxID=37682 RepID=R7W761_AEGTA
MDEDDHHGPHMVELAVVCSGAVLGQQPPPPWLLAWSLGKTLPSSNNGPSVDNTSCNLRVPEKLCFIYTTDAICELSKLTSMMPMKLRVINTDYRGPVGLMLFNHSEADFAVKPGGHIA